MVQLQRRVQSFRGRLIITITVIILVIIATVVWLESGQGPLATVFSIAFVAAAVIIGLLQWLLPMSSSDTSLSQAFPSQKMDNKLFTNTSQNQQQETHYQLPVPREPPFDEAMLPQTARFVGRDEDLHWLLERLCKGGVTGITAIRGMGGIGKTTLASVAVHQLRAEGRFQDGIAVVLCQELTDAIEVLWRVLARFDPNRHQPQTNDSVELAELAGQMLKKKDVLVVLDNVEPGLAIEHVTRPLLAAGATLLLTARQTLPVTVVPTDASRKLDLLNREQALDLFAQESGHGSSSNLTSVQRVAAEAIILALDRHTLAVKLAGAYVLDYKRDWRILAEELKDPRRMIAMPDGQNPRAMAQVFARSLEELPGDAQQFFASLASFATIEFSRQAALSLAKSLNLTDPEEYIDLLTRRALIDVFTIDNLPVGSDRERLRFHPLLRAFALNILIHWPKTKLDTIYRTITRYYAVYVRKMPPAGLSADENNIIGTLEWAYKHGENELILSLCSGMQSFWQDRGRTAASLQYLPWAIAVAEVTAGITYDRESHLRAANFSLGYGQALEQVGRPDEAERVFRSNLAVRHQMQDRQGEGEVLRSLGKLAHARGQLGEADGYYQRALRIAHEVQNRREEGAVLCSLGEVALNDGRMEEAQRYYQEALVIERELQDWRGEGEVLRSLGELASWNGLVDKANEYYRQALTIARQVHNRREEGWLLAALGFAAYKRGQMDEAEGYYQHALPIDREVQNRREEGWVLLVLGKLAQMRGLLEKAEEYFQQSLAINREVQDQREEGEVLRSLGELACWRGQVNQAKDYLQQALMINHQIQNRRGEASVLRSLGQTAQACGQVRDAQNYLLQSLTIDHEVRDQREEAETLRSLGELACCCGQVDDAQNYLQRALAIDQGEIRTRRGEGEVLYSLGELMLTQGQLEEAKGYYQKALGFAREVQNRRAEGQVLLSLGKLAQAYNHLEEAEGYYQKAIQINREVQNRREEGRLFAVLGQVAQTRKQLKNAEEYYRKGLNILSEVEDTFNHASTALKFGIFLIEENINLEEGCRMLTESADYYAKVKLPDEQGVREMIQRLGCNN